MTVTSTITTPAASDARAVSVDERPRVVTGTPRRTAWLVGGCAVAVVVAAGVTATLVHRTEAPGAPVGGERAVIGVADPGAASAGREWEQRALSPAQAPSRGLVVATSTAALVAAAPTTHGTGHGRLLVSP